MFNSILDSVSVSGATVPQMLICIATSLVLGALIMIAYMLGGRYSKPLAISLLVLPAVVQVIIMMVNGNVGAGVAVMGAFSLIRFRSVPGSAREISFIFLAMAVGLATGMGCLGLAALITVILCVVLVVLGKLPLTGGQKQEKMLKIVMPEDLDYTEVFDDIFQKYTTQAELERVKTTNLGSLFEASYLITLKDPKQEKAMIDELRCRNGNLSISCARYVTPKEQL